MVDLTCQYEVDNSNSSSVRIFAREDSIAPVLVLCRAFNHPGNLPVSFLAKVCCSITNFISVYYILASCCTVLFNKF
jgi:hypothetical protein